MKNVKKGGLKKSGKETVKAPVDLPSKKEKPISGKEASTALAVEPKTKKRKRPTTGSSPGEPASAKPAATKAADEGPQGGAGRESVDPAEKARLEKKAVEEILAAISKPEARGKPYIPEGWAKTYKPILGPYKKFLQRRPETFTVVDTLTDFVVTKTGDAESKSIAKMPQWAPALNKAWTIYCEKTKPADRSFKEFIGAYPESILNAEPGNAKSKAGGEEGTPAKTEPAAADSAVAQPKKKLKKKLKAKA